MPPFKTLAETISWIVDGTGVAIIVLGLLYAIGRFVLRPSRQDSYRRFREDIGRGILLGLEFLVGADIIHTVAVDLTYASIGVLVIVVLVRTFLSFTLELEISGRWPWQRARPSSSI